MWRIFWNMRMPIDTYKPYMHRRHMYAHQSYHKSSTWKHQTLERTNSWQISYFATTNTAWLLWQCNFLDFPYTTHNQLDNLNFFLLIGCFKKKINVLLAKKKHCYAFNSYDFWTSINFIFWWMKLIFTSFLTILILNSSYILCFTYINFYFYL